MWEGCYATEPFDLRLTLLRMTRDLGWIAGITLLGTLVFGGGYYLKNVAFGEAAMYEATAVYKIEYTNPPVQSGDYYINEMTWNTYVDSKEFYQMTGDSETIRSMGVDFDAWIGGIEGMAQAVDAAVASDIHVPSITARTPDEDRTKYLSAAVTEAVTGPFADGLAEVASIRLIDPGEVRLVQPDVRPGRAFILSAVLSCFFATIAFLLWEIGSDGIWLPATLRRRYGLKTPGTIKSRELIENMCYFYGECGNIGVCTVSEKTDPAEVIQVLQDTLQKGENEGRFPDVEWIPVPAGGMSREATRFLHGTDGVLLVVDAGLHAGKKLEYLLEFFAEQDIRVTAALLWNADEALIRSYYFLPGGRR